MSSKVHSQRNIIPFSWENKPGVSKAAAPPQNHQPSKLPPPPCPPPENSRVSYHDLRIPLPPCAFQPPPPSRAFSKKGLKKMEDDPFLIAYKEVTKSTKKGKSMGANKGNHQMFGMMKNFSCKQYSSCGVADESVIRLAQLPISRSRRD